MANKPGQADAIALPPIALAAGVEALRNAIGEARWTGGDEECVKSIVEAMASALAKEQREALRASTVAQT